MILYLKALDFNQIKNNHIWKTKPEKYANK